MNAHQCCRGEADRESHPPAFARHFLEIARWIVPGAFTEVSSVSGGLHRDWYRDRSFIDNREPYAYGARDPVHRGDHIPGGKTGMALRRYDASR